jgi:hypothetical protein
VTVKVLGQSKFADSRVLYNRYDLKNKQDFIATFFKVCQFKKDYFLKGHWTLNHFRLLAKKTINQVYFVGDGIEVT